MPLENFLPTKIAALSQRVSEAIAQVYGERFGLTRDEWRVLSAAGRATAQPTRAIQETTGLDKVAVSRAASGLEDRGLIRRTEDREDRRIKIVQLTEEGRRTVEELERIARAREAFLLEGLGLDEVRRLETMIETLTERAEALGRPETKGRCRPDCEGACERSADFLTFEPDAARTRPAAAVGRPAPARARTLEIVPGE